VERYCIAGHATDDSVIKRMRFACLRIKATDTRSEYVILLAFPLQQWLHERAAILRYAYVASLRTAARRILLSRREKRRQH